MRESSYPPKQHKEAVRTAEALGRLLPLAVPFPGNLTCLWPNKGENALFALLLALLICDRAGGLAGGLAGCLALAAAGMCGSSDAGLLDGLDVFHWDILHTVQSSFHSRYYTQIACRRQPHYFPNTCAAIAASAPASRPTPKSESSATDTTNVSARMENTMNARAA